MGESERQKRPYTCPSFTTLGSDGAKAEELTFAHTLNNRLAIILAECAVLAQSTNEPKYLMRLETIQKAAHSMADEIARFQESRMAGVMRAGAGSK